MNMRLFIAINFPKKTKEEIQKVIQPLVKDFPQVSWVKPENIHLTLKFLGNTKEDQLADVKKAVRKAIEGIKPFELKFDQLGYFARHQLIVWLGIKPGGEFISLVGKIEKETVKLGFAREKKAFFPHVTLGRAKRTQCHSDPESDSGGGSRQDSFTSQTGFGMTTFFVKEISLMQSVLSRKGAVYTSIEQFALE